MSLFRRASREPRISADAYIEKISSPAKGKSPIYAPSAGIGAPPSADLAIPARPDRNIACMVTHGMGQQVPFQTVAQVAEALKQEALFAANRVRLTPDGDLLSRLESTYSAKDGVRTNVHLYEGYWAPLTEGKISFWQTISFLYSGGIAGIATCLRYAKGEGFNRWMFGDVRRLPIKPGTLGYLILTLLVVSVTVLLYAESLHVLTEAPAAWRGGPGLPTLSFSIRHPHLWKAIAAFAAWIGQLLAFAWRHVRALFLLLLAVVYTHYLNYFVVQYAGDIAIYVSSYKVSKFQETRTAIEESIFTVGSQIYRAVRDEAGTPLYDEIVLVGHSLGSVITYDLLNRLIVWDQKQFAGRYRVVDRTTRLITFGSPLDKTAFLFRTQISPHHHYREALAGLQQPLILTYAVRPKTFEWVNLYSPSDIISGYLEYYDEPTNNDPNDDEPVIDDTNDAKKSSNSINKIKNERDSSAWIPIYAHTQYWAGRSLADKLASALFAHKKQHEEQEESEE